MNRHLTIFFLFLLSLGSFANHIVGGEIYYDRLGNDQYRITLKVYRDCFSGVDFDGTGGVASPAFLTIFSSSSPLGDVYDLGAPVVTPVPPAFNNPCIMAPSGTCIEEGVYSATVTLPPLTGGYTLVYQRCCRTSGIANLNNSVTQGSTYFIRIPGPEEVSANSSPRFTRFPPIYICNGIPFTFDHSATDPDGDQLVYSLCAPFTGLDACCPSLGIAGSPATSTACAVPPSSCPTAAAPPPYDTVLFALPYSGNFPMPSNPAFSIDPLTGKLSGTPTLIAQYVVGVCVKEYRNNVLINKHFRDFQFTVVPCNVAALSLVAEQAQQCQGQVITFTNQSITNSPSPVFHWDFGVPNLSSDTSNLVNPSYNYPDTGIYVMTLITNPGKPCSDTLKKPVYVYPPLKINYANASQRQCFRNNAFNFTTGGIYLQQTSYSWDFTSHASPSVSVQKNPAGIHFLESGLFFVKLKASQFACRDSFIDSVRVLGRAKVRFSNLQNNLCDPATISFSNSSSSDLPVHYTWKFSNGKTSSQFEPTQLFSPGGTYGATLIAETASLCSDTAVAVITTITIYPKPAAAFDLTPHETSIFEPEISVKSLFAGAATVAYDFGDGTRSAASQGVHAYAQAGNYRITQTLTNSFGCTDTTSDSVKILPEFNFWIPNTFTPDDNAKNDLFMPVVSGITAYEFEVFNRWGQQIFRTSNSSEGWNGSYKGLPSPQDVYTWKIRFTNVVSSKEETHLGFVTLLRNPW